MKLIKKIIIIVSILVILLFSYIGSITEPATTLSQLYTKQAETDTTSAGFTKGFAGSGANVSDISANTLTKYNQNKYDVEYHDPPEEVLKDSNSIIKFNEVMVFDPSINRMVVLPYSEQAGSPIYYEPNSKKYSSKNYVPDYESSVLLSRSNNVIQ